MRHWRTRAVGGLTALVVLAGAVLVVRWWRSSEECRSDVGEPESTEDVTLERRTGDEVAEPPEAASGFDRADYDDAAAALMARPGGSTLGDLEALLPGAYDDETGWEVPQLVGLWGDDLVVASDSGGLPGLPWETALAAVDLGGSPSPGWVRSFEGRAIGGGRVGDRLVAMSIPEGRAPEVASMDQASGEVVWCQRIGSDDETPWMPAFDGSETADGDLLVTRFVTDDDGDRIAGARTLRIDAGTGDVVWDVTGDEPEDVRRQHVSGSVVVQSRRNEGGPDPPVRYGQDEDGRRVFRPQREPVVARHLGDGTVAWTYAPEDGDDANTAQLVIGATDERVVVAQGRAEVDMAGGGDRERDVTREGRIVALDQGGEVVWERDVDYGTLRDAARTFTLAGDLVVGPIDDDHLGAWHLDDGSVAWEPDSGWLSVEDAEVVDGRLLVPDGGLTEIDLETGRAEPALDGIFVSEITVGDDRVVLRTEIGIAVFARR